MELNINEMLDNSSLKVYSSEVASQEKVILRIKKQEQDVDIEGKDTSTDEETVSYTCEFVQKVEETKSDTDELDESIETVRQDENFIYPAITNSDEEDTSDATWQPPSTILTAGERKHIKCLYPKVNKPLPKKKKYKKSNACEAISAKRMKNGHLSKTKQVLEDINVPKPATDFVKPDVTATNELLTKKASDSLTPKVYKPRKGMATPKQRLGRIIKIHKMMK